MRVVALLSVRNEELYLARCLEHLYTQGIETCVIDNASTDRTLEIAKSYVQQGVCRIEHLPYEGGFDLIEILRNEEKLANDIHADWFIHHNADEIREAPYPYRTLLEGIEDADRQGYNAIDFDEFDFLPCSEDEAYEGTDYVAEMQYYYFFKPRSLLRINAWKKSSDKVDIVHSGGHAVKFAGRKIFPVNFVLRHYIFLSKTHAIAKYGQRVYAIRSVVEMGWSRQRAGFTPDKLRLPERKRLKKVSENRWDKSDPWIRHEFLGG